MAMTATNPVVWLDVLDLPLVYYTETAYHIEGPSQNVRAGKGVKGFARGGLVPTAVFGRGDKAYPLLHFPWSETRAALKSLASDSPSSKACN